MVGLGEKLNPSEFEEGDDIDNVDTQSDDTGADDEQGDENEEEVVEEPPLIHFPMQTVKLMV